MSESDVGCTLAHIKHDKTLINDTNQVLAYIKGLKNIRSLKGQDLTTMFEIIENLHDKPVSADIAV